VPLSLEYTKISLDVFKKINYNFGIAHEYINYGLGYKADKKFDLAIQSFNKAKFICEKLNDTKNIAHILYELLETYNEQNKLNDAIEL
jgi:tetratricopeptide (TPR) repeat protein